MNTFKLILLCVVCWASPPTSIEELTARGWSFCYRVLSSCLERLCRLVAALVQVAQLLGVHLHALVQPEHLVLAHLFDAFNKTKR